VDGDDLAMIDFIQKIETLLSNVNYHPIVVALLVSAIIDGIRALQKKAPVLFVSPYLKLITETRYLYNLVYSKWGQNVKKYVALNAIKTTDDGNSIQVSTLIENSIWDRDPLLLLGLPGAGKTTAIEAAAYRIAFRGYAFYVFLWVLILGVAERFLFVNPLYSLLWLAGFIIWQPIVTRMKIPILVRGNKIQLVANYSTWKKDLLAEKLKTEYHDHIQTRIIWFIDGVNEISKDSYFTMVRQWREELENDSKTIIFTSRQLDDPSENLNIAPGFVYSINDLDDKGVKLFFKVYGGKSTLVSNYTGQRNPDDSQKVFLNLLYQRNLLGPKGIARNPLWLKIIIESDFLSKNKGKLFLGYVKQLLERELDLVEKNTELRKKYPAWKEIVLAPEEMKYLSHLALSMQLDNKVGYHNKSDWDKGLLSIQDEIPEFERINAADVIYEAEAANILRVIPNEKMEFAHQQIQEFFTAYALRDPSQWNIVIENNDSENESWLQTIFLFVGLLDEDQGQISQFLHKLLDTGGSEIKRRRTFLALGCLVSLENQNSEDINFVIQALIDVIGGDLNAIPENIIAQMKEKLGDEAAEAFSLLYFDLENKSKVLGARLLCLLQTNRAAEILLAPFETSMGNYRYTPIISGLFDEAFFAFSEYAIGNISRSTQYDKLVIDIFKRYPSRAHNLVQEFVDAGYHKNGNRSIDTEILSIVPTKESISLLLGEIETTSSYRNKDKERYARNKPVMQALLKISEAKAALVLESIIEQILQKNLSLDAAKDLLSEINNIIPNFNFVVARRFHIHETIKHPELFCLLNRFSFIDKRNKQILINLAEKKLDQAVQISILEKFIELALDDNFFPDVSASFETSLRKFARHRNSDIRMFTAQIMGLSKDNKYLEILSKSLAKDKDYSVRLSAVNALGLFNNNKDALRAVTKKMSDKDNYIQRAAIKSLANFNSSFEVESRLLKYAQDENHADVRDTALEELYSINPEAVTLDVFKQSTRGSSYYAGQWIQLFSDSRNNELLNYILDCFVLASKNSHIYMLQDLSELKDERILEIVVKDVIRDHYFDTSNKKILANFTQEQVLTMIYEQLKESRLADYKYWPFFKRLKKEYGRDFGEYALQLLDSENEVLKEEVITYIGDIQYDEAVDKIIQLHSEKDSIERQEKTIQTLAAIRSPKAVPFLMKLLRSEQKLKQKVTINLEDGWEGIKETIQAIANPTELFKAKIIKAIGDISHKPTREMLEYIRQYLSSDMLAGVALKTLCRLGDERSVVPSIDFLLEESKESTIYDERILSVFSNVKEQAANEMLFRLNEKNDLNDSKHWHDIYDLKRWLRILKPEVLFEFYCKQLFVTDVNKRIDAAIYLAEIKNTDALPVLEYALTKNRSMWSGWSQAHEALEYLKYIQEQEGVKPQGAS
jgi:HEAT repeat protein